MPGAVSDSYDPEFGTNTNRLDVIDGIEEVGKLIDSIIGQQLHNIVEVAQGEDGVIRRVTLSERQLRIIRFALIRTWNDLNGESE